MVVKLFVGGDVVDSKALAKVLFCYPGIIILLFSCKAFKISLNNRTFAPNLEAHLHAKNKKYSDYRTR